MQKECEQQVGVLLQAIPYLDNHRILKIFTPHTGLLSVIAKHVSTKTAAVTTPFCVAEWIYRKTHGEIHALKDATLLDSLQNLRRSYLVLSNASAIARDLLRSQLPNRPSISLYELLMASFQNLSKNPLAISLSFRLKLLQYEGLIRLQDNCSHCNEKATRLYRGESLCNNHAAIGSIVFDDIEWQQLLTLGLGRRFSLFVPIEPQASLVNKIEQLFIESHSR